MSTISLAAATCQALAAGWSDPEQADCETYSYQKRAVKVQGQLTNVNEPEWFVKAESVHAGLHS